MGCFSLQWLEQLLIDLIIIGAVVAILRLLVPWVLSIFGIGGMIVQIINIILWAIIAIFVVIFVFQLIQCLIGAGGFSLFTLPRTR